MARLLTIISNKGCNKGRKAPCRCELTKDERSVPRFIQDWLAAAGKSWNQSPTPLGCTGIGLWCKDLESHNTPFVFLITFVICCDFAEVFAVAVLAILPVERSVLTFARSGRKPNLSFVSSAVC